MPKLEKELIVARSKTGQRYSDYSDFYVSTRGKFSAVIPTDLHETARNVKRPNGVYVERDPRSRKLRVWANDMHACWQFLQKCAHTFVECDAHVERVILYRAPIDITYWQNPDGSLAPCGKIQDKDGQFKGNLNATQRSASFRVGFGAVVRDKVTYTSPYGTRDIYVYPPHTKNEVPKGTPLPEDNPWVGKLNSFVGLDFSVTSEGRHGEWEEMPFSETAAAFFYEVLMEMCHMADRMAEFFGSREKVMQAIETGGAKLLTGGEL